MAEIVIEKWTDEQKEVMLEVSKDMYVLMNKKLKNKLMIANCLDIFNRCYSQQIGLNKIMRVTKDGKIIKHHAERVINIINGMTDSDVNLILFRNDPEVLLQYYMGLFFERPTFLIAEEKEKSNIDKLLKSNLVKQIEYVKNLGNQQELTKAMDRMRPKMEGKSERQNV